MSKNMKKQLWNYCLIFIGTLLLAFGSVIFLSEAELVAGGVSGIAIIIQNAVAKSGSTFQTYDITVAVLTVLSLVIGFIFIGKDFSFKTLVASVLYIGFTFIFKRIGFFTDLAQKFAGIKIVEGVRQSGDTGNLMLCGLFGGIFVGAGVAFTFLGGGSSGGVDVLQVILRKKFGIKESVTSPLLDILVIVVGMITMQMWVESLCGVLSSLTTAFLIELVYIKNQSSYQVDVVSTKWELINEFAHNELDRGTTLVNAKGGYSGTDYIILRVVIDKPQYEQIRNFIADVDPKAFVTITQTNAVYGEGFKYNQKKGKKLK